ncbi:MAG: DUF1573 domain-containing protein [Lewinellaceae bacterium]|nr:DUF1573 domain-containing protein [Lewinellaceae bacterium]
MKLRAFAVLVLLFFVSVSGIVAQTMQIGDPTLNAGKVQWIPMQIETGDVPFAVPVERTIEAKNISDEDLVILAVVSGCHCTVAEWTKEPIPPGKSGVIKLVFDALKEGEFYKVISITTNFDPETNLALGMTGTVLPKE